MGSVPSALASVELLVGLEPEHIEAVASIGKVGIFHKGDIIVKKGEYSNDLYFVLSGQVEVIAELAANQSSLVLLGAGQSFGEMALLDAGPRSATIRCISNEAEIMIINGNTLIDLWQHECPLGYQMMSNIARDLAFKLRIRNLTSTMTREA